MMPYATLHSQGIGASPFCNKPGYLRLKIHFNDARQDGMCLNDRELDRREQHVPVATSTTTAASPIQAPMSVSPATNHSPNNSSPLTALTLASSFVNAFLPSPPSPKHHAAQASVPISNYTLAPTTTTSTSRTRTTTARTSYVAYRTLEFDENITVGQVWRGEGETYMCHVVRMRCHVI